MLGSGRIAANMVIRREQMNAFQKVFSVRFEDRVFAHVSDTFAEEAERLGARGTHERISESLSAASQYGFSTERNLVFYVDLTFIFGADYDGLSWANSVLTDAAVTDEDEKRRRLMNAAGEHAQDAGVLVPPRAR
jgi:hypothetical protein